MTGGGEDDTDGLKPVPCSECGKTIDGVRRHKNHVLQFGVIVCEECSINDDEVGVRGRQEILRALEEKIEDIKENPDEYMLHGPKLALLDDIKSFVLGEVDDL